MAEVGHSQADDAYGTKRKLSVLADLQEDASKRTKTDAVQVDASSDASKISTDTAAKANAAEGDGAQYAELGIEEDADETPNEIVSFRPSDKAVLYENAYQLDGKGPYTFFTWADGIREVLYKAPVDDAVYVVLKNAALEASQKLDESKKSDGDEEAEAEDKEDEDEDEYWDRDTEKEAMEVVRPFAIVPVRGSLATSGVKALRRQFDELRKSKGEKSGKTKANTWWCEVTLQQERPTGGAEGLKLRVEHSVEAWWLTDIRLADEKGTQAMLRVTEYNPNPYEF